MKTKQTKEKIQQQINDIFSNNPSKIQIKKAKKLASSKNIKLTKYKKKYCNKCLTFFNYSNHQVRIKKQIKTIKCNSCNFISRYKLNISYYI